VPQRVTHPILANILLVAGKESQRVTLTAFDLSLGIQASFEAEVEEGGEITIPAKLFGEIVSRLPSGEITLKQKEAKGEEGAIVQITSTNGRYQIRAKTAEEFPELPSVKAKTAVNLPAQALIDGLKGLLAVASTVDTPRSKDTGILRTE
jgi:DNA polymerase-3 subunit beta